MTRITDSITKTLYSDYYFNSEWQRSKAILGFKYGMIFWDDIPEVSYKDEDGKLLLKLRAPY